jgi:hypothetical protein
MENKSESNHERQVDPFELSFAEPSIPRGFLSNAMALPDAGIKLARSLAAQATVARKPGTPRRARIRRKPIAQGRLGRSG